MNTFHAAHYNAIAKDIREEFANITAEPEIQRDYRVIVNAQKGTLAALALKLAERFKADNELFDPLKFLDQCSPDVDLYPLSELWEDVKS